VTSLVVGVFAGLAVALALGQGGRSVAALDAAARQARFGARPFQRALHRVRPGGRSSDRDGGRVRVVVAQVSALLRAGAPPGAAWTRAAGVPVDELGVPEPAALGAVVGDGPARAVCAATRLALTVGAPLGRVLEAVSDALVAQAEAAAEREAALAGPRTTARVLLWLPAAGALLGWTLGADPVAVATDGRAGTAAVAAGLVLLAVGRWWTGRLVAAARRAGAEP
jgi:tight adherence protein B